MTSPVPGRRAPGLRLHERTMTVQRAESAIHGYVLAAMAEFDLSYAETAMILSSLTGNALKYVLRGERHPGDPGRKADEE